MTRNHQNYLGLTKPELVDEKTGLVLVNPFIFIREINLFDWSIHCVHEACISTETFDDGLDPVTDFRRETRIELDKFDALKNTYPDVFNTLDVRFKGIVLPPPSASAVFESASFRVLDYRLDINYKDGGRPPTCRLIDADYHAQIAMNFDVIGFDAQGNKGLIPILHEAAAEKYPEYFANTTLISPK